MTVVARELSSAAARAALLDLPDPELPVVSIDELGILGRVDSGPDGIRVEIHPTFVACPATELIRAAVVERLGQVAPGVVVDVALVFDPPWTSDRIGPGGRVKLASAGIAPPLVSEPNEMILLDPVVPCPMCGSRRTRLDNLFGPTLCRTIRWCSDCRQPFEAIKTI
ncbi:MAG: 1,2-phenylacetyl-CoA epoxidase subunit PaaD [Chloroflexota bacterium]